MILPMGAWTIWAYRFESEWLWIAVGCLLLSVASFALNPTSRVFYWTLERKLGVSRHQIRRQIEQHGRTRKGDAS